MDYLCQLGGFRSNSDELEQARAELKRLQDLAEDQKNQLQRVQEQNKELKAKLEELHRKVARVNPALIDTKHRGCENPKLRRKVTNFFQTDGKYVTLGELMEEDKDWSEKNISALFTGITELAYDTAQDAVFTQVIEKLKKLFQYQKDAKGLPEDDHTYTDLQSAYGLLLHHLTTDDKQSIRKRHDMKLQIRVRIEKNEDLKLLMKKVKEGKHNQEYNEFVGEISDLMIQMITSSPPVIVHFPDEFDPKMVWGEQYQGPLRLKTPALLENYYGKVWVKAKPVNVHQFKLVGKEIEVHAEEKKSGVQSDQKEWRTNKNKDDSSKSRDGNEMGNDRGDKKALPTDQTQNDGRNDLTVKKDEKEELDQAENNSRKNNKGEKPKLKDGDEACCYTDKLKLPSITSESTIVEERKKQQITQRKVKKKKVNKITRVRGIKKTKKNRQVQVEGFNNTRRKQQRRLRIKRTMMYRNLKETQQKRSHFP